MLFTGVSLESVRVRVWGCWLSRLVLSCLCSVTTMAATKVGIDWVGRFAVTDGYCGYWPTERVLASYLLTCTMPATIFKSKRPVTIQYPYGPPPSLRTRMFLLRIPDQSTGTVSRSATTIPALRPSATLLRSAS